MGSKFEHFSAVLTHEIVYGRKAMENYFENIYLFAWPDPLLSPVGATCRSGTLSSVSKQV